MVLSSLLSYFKPSSSQDPNNPISTQKQFLSQYVPLADKPYAVLPVNHNGTDAGSIMPGRSSATSSSSSSPPPPQYQWELFRISPRQGSSAVGKSLMGGVASKLASSWHQRHLNASPRDSSSSNTTSSSDASQLQQQHHTITASTQLTPNTTLTLFVLKLDATTEDSFTAHVQSENRNNSAAADSSTAQHHSSSSSSTPHHHHHNNNTEHYHNTMRLYARSFIQKQKTIRHPSMLQYIDSFELNDRFYLVTEYCVPLTHALKKISLSHHFHSACQWGLFQIAQGLHFLHQNQMTHHYLNKDCIFVVRSGDWKLTGMAFLTSHRELPTSSQQDSTPSDQPHASQSNPLPSTLSEVFDLFATTSPQNAFSHQQDPSSDSPVPMNLLNHAYLSPEMASRDLHAIAQYPERVDSWGMAVLIYQIFIAPQQEGSSNKYALTQRSQLQKLPKILSAKIPSQLFRAYKHLVFKNMKQRWDMNRFSHCQYFSESEYVDTLLFLEEIALKESEEIDDFLNELSAQLEEEDRFPRKCIKYRILPTLVSCVKYGSASKASIRSLFLIGTLLNDHEYKCLFVPAMIELFSMDNVLVQLNLLQNINQIVDSIESDSVVEERIFRGCLEKWFHSKVSKVREMSVKALIPVVPRLSEQCIDSTVIRILWALLGDSEGSIRTNTIIVTGKLVPFLSTRAREKLLLPAISKALKDPFKHSRLHALKVLADTREHHTPADIVNKVIPIISSRMMDPSDEIREITIDTMQSLVAQMKRLNDAQELVPKKSSSGDEGSSQSEGEDQSGSFSWALSSMKRVIGRKSDDTSKEKPSQSVQETKSGGFGVTVSRKSNSRRTASQDTQKEESIFLEESQETKPTRKWSNAFSQPKSTSDESTDVSSAGIKKPKRLQKSSPTKSKNVPMDDPFESDTGGGWEIDIPDSFQSASKTDASDDDIFGDGGASNGAWEIDIPDIPVMQPTQKSTKPAPKKITSLKGMKRTGKAASGNNNTSGWSDDW